MSELVPGLYQDLLTRALERRLSELQSTLYDTSPLDVATSHETLARHVYDILRSILADQSGTDAERLTRQAAIANSVLEHLRAQASLDPATLIPMTHPPRELLAIRDGSGIYTTSAVERPVIPLAQSALLVNGRGQPRIGSELAREIASATDVDLLCAFLKWHGYRIVRDRLEGLLKRGGRVRVLTTTFLGSTERRVIDDLVALGAEVKVSYDTSSTRLHAKAWLFTRPTISTAYIGSSNLSKTALQDGLEWNVRLTTADHSHLIGSFRAAFEEYWEDSSFEEYLPDRDGARFDLAVRSELPSSDTPFELSPLDVRPYPYQQEVLERLEADRTLHQRWRSLVVMATGTGKTVVAGLDYRRLRDAGIVNRLLFVAHREEILTQSLRTFRQVLRDGSHGELLVGGRRPSEWSHVYASIQSLSGLDDDALPADRFDMVIVDEFHHAEARTYARLLERLQPKVLLGLTATPERADGGDVTRWFDGRIAVELRLWEALERSILAPFQYFGIADNTDLSQLTWRRGAYDLGELSLKYQSDRGRVAIVVDALRKTVAEPRRMRALGFCVSIAHAEFMAQQFSAAGIPSRAVTSKTAADERQAAIAALRSREINALFSVDLFNEGFDLPDIDTVLLLRPTESATVFLQQLGRGLRLADDKACLTVLDFIGQQHRQFRFDLRFSSLTGVGRRRVAQAVEDDFPELPPGCHIDLDRVSKEIILSNVKQAISRNWRELVSDLQQRKDPTLHGFLESNGLTLEDLYRDDKKGWMNLRVAAGLHPARSAAADQYVRGLRRMVHVDDPERIDVLRRVARSMVQVPTLSVAAQRQLAMLFFNIAGPDGQLEDLQETLRGLADAEVQAEVLEFAGELEERLDRITYPLGLERVPLRVHATYTRDEALAAFGHRRPSTVREGVCWLPEELSDVFFVTLRKSEHQFSPTTMYKDRAISQRLFQWESQNRTTVASEVGRRYINHAREGTSVHLFVRTEKESAVGNAAPYFYAGRLQYVRHVRERPIEFLWELERELPPDVFQEAKTLAA